jgi:AraC family transcriptional regulator of arabinose operon
MDENAAASISPDRYPAPGAVYRTMGGGSPWQRIGCGVMDKQGVSDDQLASRSSTWSMIYLMRGRGWYDDQHGQRFELTAGDCFVRVPGVLHSTRLDPRSRWLEGFIDLGPELWAALAGMQVLRATPPVWSWGLSSERIERFTRLRSDLLHARERQLPALCLRVLALALDAHPLPESPQAADAIDRACNALTEQATTRLDLRSWCLRESLDYEQFRKDFLRRMGVSPGQYRLRRRMDRACELLQSSQRAVGEIAADLGYRSPYEFSAQFRARMGMPPSRYRSLRQRGA